MAMKYTIEDMKALAAARGGECLSDEYAGILHKYIWKCNECTNVWETRATIIQSGAWCPKCGLNKSRKTKKYSINTFRELASSRNGICLSDKYISLKSKLKFKCSICDHSWNALAGNVLYGAWCPSCAGKTITIQKMKDIATSRNGKCLSEKYLGMHKKLIWECSKGHIWDAIPASIRMGRWCIQCFYESMELGLGERLFIEAIEEGTGLTFKKTRPSWLRNPASGKPLELDGYNPERKIAVEYQGMLHYKFIPHFHIKKSEYVAYRQRDSLKRRLCAENGVLLIQLHEISHPSKSKMIAALVEYCIRNAVPLELNPEYAEMLALPNYGLDSEA